MTKRLSEDPNTVRITRECPKKQRKTRNTVAFTTASSLLLPIPAITATVLPGCSRGPVQSAFHRPAPRPAEPALPRPGGSVELCCPPAAAPSTSTSPARGARPGTGTRREQRGARRDARCGMCDARCGMPAFLSSLFPRVRRLRRVLARGRGWN